MTTVLPNPKLHCYRRNFPQVPDSACSGGSGEHRQQLAVAPLGSVACRLEELALPPTASGVQCSMLAS